MEDNNNIFLNLDSVYTEMVQKYNSSAIDIVTPIFNDIISKLQIREKVVIPEDYEYYKHFYMSIKQEILNDNQNISAKQITNNDLESHYLPDQLLTFINCQNAALIDKIPRENKLISIPKSYIRTRLEQAAYQFCCNPSAFDEDRKPEDSWWQYREAPDIIKQNINYLMGLFFLTSIYNPIANYDYKHNGITEYIPFIKPESDKPENQEKCILLLHHYNAILYGNLEKVFDDTITKKDITDVHINFVVNKLINCIIQNNIQCNDVPLRGRYYEPGIISQVQTEDF